MLSNGGKGPPPQAVWTFPKNEATGVALKQSIRVQFDRFLSPASAVRQGVCVQATTVGAGATDECIGGLTPQYDPVDRVAVWVPSVPLMPMTRYNVRLLPPKDENDANGIRAFDGVPLEKEFTFAFTTGDATAVAVEPKRDIGFCSLPSLCMAPKDVCSEPPVDTLYGPSSLLNACAGSTGSCHTPPPPNVIETGLVGSVLSFKGESGVPDAVRLLVERSIVATETATGPDPAAPRRSSKDIFGQNMPVIDKTNPGNSYLLYKLILALPPRCPFDPSEESANPIFGSSACKGNGYGSPEGFTTNEYKCSDFPPPQPTDSTGACPTDGGVTLPTPVGMPGQRIPPLVEPWVPDAEWQPPAKGEYNRLRLRIRGDGMSVAGPGFLTAHQDALAISAWIAAGAAVSTCL